MKYWIDLFTWTTWQEFLEVGGNISGFRRRRWPTVQKIALGDQFLCYMTGISRFFALLEVTGEPCLSEEPIWNEDIFPVVFPSNWYSPYCQNMQYQFKTSAQICLTFAT